MNYYLAPMEGVTGRIFRQTYHSCFPAMDKYFAPFVTPSDDGNLSPKDFHEIAPEYNPGMNIIPQILTNHADGFIRTAKVLKAMGFEEVNFNLGCPSGTVVGKKRGSGFLAFPVELDHFLEEVFSKTDMKISIKTRVGKLKEEEFQELLEIYNRYPIEELIIHPRIREDYYKNSPRMEAFQQGFLHSLSPVCYNGDIFTADDYAQLTEKYPTLDRIMMGRGIVANPGLLSHIQTGVPVSLEAWKEFHDRLYHSYQEQFLASSGERVVLFKMKEVWCYMISMFQDSKRHDKKIKKSQTLHDYEAAVSSLFRECPFSPCSGYVSKV